MHPPHSYHYTIILAATQARVSSGIPWITKMVCELSVDPPADFHCNATTPIDILSLSNADMVGCSLRPTPCPQTLLNKGIPF